MEKKAESFTSSVIDDNYCAYVDMENGMWWMCELFEHATAMNGQPFTTSWWIEQNNSDSNNRKFEQHEHM